MSTLTKICVIVLVLLVLFASGPFIQQAVIGPDWKQACQKQERRAELAEASDKTHMHEADTYKSLLKSERDNAVAKARDDRNKITGRDIEISRLTGQLAENSSAVKTLTTFNENIRLNLESQIKSKDELQKKLEDKRDENIVLNRQLRSAQHIINKQQTDLEISERSVRSIQEQLAQKDAENADLREQLLTTGTKVATIKPMVKGPKVNAAITAVRGDLASMSAGSASGVKKDMEFVIYRSEHFVAHLRIAEVGVSESTGVIYDRTREPKVGDKASNNLE